MRRPRKQRKSHASLYSLNLTALVDAFTILIVFLLNSYSTASFKPSLNKNIQPPYTKNAFNPQASTLLSITEDGIYQKEQLLVSLNKGSVLNKDIEDNDEQYISTLGELINKEDFAKKENDLLIKQGLNPSKSSVVILADNKIPALTLKRVIYTLGVGGFSEIQLGSIHAK